MHAPLGECLPQLHREVIYQLLPYMDIYAMIRPVRAPPGSQCKSVEPQRPPSCSTCRERERDAPQPFITLAKAGAKVTSRPFAPGQGPAAAAAAAAAENKAPGTPPRPGNSGKKRPEPSLESGIPERAGGSLPCGGGRVRSERWIGLSPLLWREGRACALGGSGGREDRGGGPSLYTRV